MASASSVGPRCRRWKGSGDHCLGGLIGRRCLPSLGGGGGEGVGGSRGCGLGAFFEPNGRPLLLGANAKEAGGGDGDLIVATACSGDSGTAIVEEGLNTGVTVGGAEEDGDLLANASLFLAAFSAVSAAVSSRLLALTCFFFNNSACHCSFFVGGGLGSSTGMPRLASTSASWVFVTFFVKTSTCLDS